MTTPEKPRFEVTCMACRLGEHDQCHALIIVSSGHLEGIHTCACRHPRKPNVTAEVHLDSKALQ